MPIYGSPIDLNKSEALMAGKKTLGKRQKTPQLYDRPQVKKKTPQLYDRPQVKRTPGASADSAGPSLSDIQKGTGMVAGSNPSSGGSLPPVRTSSAAKGSMDSYDSSSMWSGPSSSSTAFTSTSGGRDYEIGTRTTNVSGGSVAAPTSSIRYAPPDGGVNGQSNVRVSKGRRLGGYTR